ncbi:MAG: HDOD domain-containing protein [Gemmataceae bacterium]
MTEPADRECPPPSRTSRAGGDPLLHAATGLPWLAPAASSLTLLARPHSAPWPTLRHDPGAVLLLLRSSPHDPSSPFVETLLADPRPLKLAVRLIDQPGSCLDWHDPRARPLYESCLTLARLTRGLARRCGRADPEQAWCAGLLAPLGWLALAAVAPGRVAAALLDSAFGRDPVGTPGRHLGVDPAVVSRRLALQWTCPPGSPASSHLGCPWSTPAASASTRRCSP